MIVATGLQQIDIAGYLGPILQTYITLSSIEFRAWIKLISCYNYKI